MQTEQGPRAATAAALAREHLARTGNLRMRVTGASMLPSLRPGDELEIVSCAIAELSPGAIALCRLGDRLVVHRVVGVAGGRLLTQGDALARPDPSFAAEDVLGRLQCFHRQARQRLALPPARLSRLGGRLMARSDLLTKLFLHWLNASRQQPA